MDFSFPFSSPFEAMLTLSPLIPNFLLVFHGKIHELSVINEDNIFTFSLTPRVENKHENLLSFAAGSFQCFMHGTRREVRDTNELKTLSRSDGKMCNAFQRRIVEGTRSSRHKCSLMIQFLISRLSARCQTWYVGRKFRLNELCSKVA